MINFKSYVPEVTNTDDIYDRIGYALNYQYMFERKPSPWEMDQWDPNELQNFTIDVDRIDRLYHIESEDDAFGGRYSMLARMEYKDTHVFVELNASCDDTGFDCCGGGDINLIMNPNDFSKVMNWDRDKMEKLYQCLAEDGYQLDPLPLS